MPPVRTRCNGQRDWDLIWPGQSCWPIKPLQHCTLAGNRRKWKLQVESVCFNFNYIGPCCYIQIRVGVDVGGSWLEGFPRACSLNLARDPHEVASPHDSWGSPKFQEPLFGRFSRAPGRLKQPVYDVTENSPVLVAHPQLHLPARQRLLKRQQTIKKKCQ